MKSRSFFALSLVLLNSSLLSVAAPAQDGTVTARVLDKIAKTDVLYNMLPLLLTKKQILELLPIIEKARDNIKKTVEKEDEMFKQVETIAETDYKRAIEKNILPSEEDRVKMATALFAFRTQRQKVASDNIDMVQPEFDKIVNAGQRKVAANSLNVKAFLPDAKPEQMTDAEKERLFVRYVLLDPASYEMLTDMAKARND